MLYIGEKVGSGRRPAHRHRARSAGRHHADRQGDGQRAGGDGLGAGRHPAERARHLHGQDRLRAGLSGRGHRSRPQRRRQRHARWPRPRASTPSEITVCVLDRPRHAEIIASLRDAGARVRLITDGDVAGVINTADPDDRRRPLHRPGRRARGRAGLRGAEVRRRPVPGPAGVPQRRRARAAPSGIGITDLDKKYDLHEMVRADAIFAATGVTNGALLDGVRIAGGFVHTHSLVMNSATRTVREVRMKRRALMGLPAVALEPTLADDFLGVARSLSGRRWRARPADVATGARASGCGSGLAEPLARALASRGDHGRGGRDLPAPDAEGAVSRSVQLPRHGPGRRRSWSTPWRRGRPIVVFADYDVDGASSAAQLVRWFRAMGARAADLRARPHDRGLWPEPRRVPPSARGAATSWWSPSTAARRPTTPWPRPARSASRSWSSTIT